MKKNSKTTKETKIISLEAAKKEEKTMDPSITKAAGTIAGKISRKSTPNKKKSPSKTTTPKVKEKPISVADTAKETPAKAAPAPKKKTASKSSPKAKKASVKNEMVIQYAGKSLELDDLIKRAKEVWKKELKRKIADFGSTKFYIKPEENMVYFVVNGTDEGKFSI